MMEIIKLIFDFLSDIKWFVLIVIIIFVFRGPLNGLIQRLVRFKWKGGNTELSVEATDKVTTKENGEVNAPSLEKPIEKSEQEKIEEEVTDKEGGEDKSWYTRVDEALDEGRVFDAKAIFKEIEEQEKDNEMLLDYKAVFLYLLYFKGNDNTAINALQELAKSAKDDDTRYFVLDRLSACLENSEQNEVVIDLWEKSAKQFKSEEYITRAIVRQAKALTIDANDEKLSKAKTLLISRLKHIVTNDEKSTIFFALSKLEEKLDNHVLSVYCMDKSIEYNPKNKDTLFSAAYEASEHGLDDISISNYVSLLKIDNDNAAVLNNLGVKAEKEKLYIKAIENYKESSKYENTLAMANEGNLLLKSGFTSEAKKVAKEAETISKGNPHKNVYALLTRISEQKEEEDEKWNEIIRISKKRQKFIREYTGAYYAGINNNFSGEWISENGNKVDIEVTGNKIAANWGEMMNLMVSLKYTISITGTITKSTFHGVYSKVDKERQGALLLGSLNEKFSCLGVLSEDGSELKIMAEDSKQKFSLLLKKDK